MNRTFITIIIILFTGCTTSNPTTGDISVPRIFQVSRISSEASSIELGGPNTDCAKLDFELYGFPKDYERLLQGCIAKNSESMHKFFWLTKYGGFHGIRSELHATITGVLSPKTRGSILWNVLIKREAGCAEVRSRGLAV